MNLNASSKFIWDFWYYFEPAERLFHIIYLNADRDLVSANQHHFHARLGYAVTSDFERFNWIDDNVFSADPEGWDNTSIWSGDLIPLGDTFLLFYTSRDQAIDDSMTQNVGIAQSYDFIHWERIPEIRIQPDATWYEACNRQADGDDSTHAWRDPFVFVDQEHAYMLLAAKATCQPLGLKGAIALLRAEGRDLTRWETLPPLLAPGWYSEMEVPQLYRHANGRFATLFSTWAKGDHAPTSKGQGGLQAIFIDQLSPRGRREFSHPEVLLPESSGLYACRVLPELDGEICGFDIKQGGWRKSGVKTQLRPMNRDFASFYLPGRSSS